MNIFFWTRRREVLFYTLINWLIRLTIVKKKYSKKTVLTSSLTNSSYMVTWFIVYTLATKTFSVFHSKMLRWTLCMKINVYKKSSRIIEEKDLVKKQSMHIYEIYLLRCLNSKAVKQKRMNNDEITFTSIIGSISRFTYYVTATCLFIQG